jgi:hypothetical protein
MNNKTKVFILVELRFWQLANKSHNKQVTIKRHTRIRVEPGAGGSCL